MSYHFESKDGLMQSNNIDHVALWNKVGEDMKIQEQNMIAKLRSHGVKASHPDDYWANNVKNEVTLVYPEFDDGVDIGDIIALTGWDCEITRFIKVTGKIKRHREYPTFIFEPILKEKEKLSFWQKILRVF